MNGRRRSNLFATAFVAFFLAAGLFIDWTGKKEPKKDIVAEKQHMQRADQIKRKGYEIEYLSGSVCGYYYWKDEMKWNTDSYCVGRHGTVKALPDSLNFWHRRMIEEVDKIAQRKGYGGWR